ncbi:serine O-acetyltransferase [Pseudosulfitobacter sp. SM2401]|uniref:serine O-acetyltransferase n=1 Tax=Pseudosulfitobacter sp. SM2401 TaxID=3350098 RepID=UPI0036F1D1BC
MKLVDDVRTLLNSDTQIAGILDLSPFDDAPTLLGSLLGSICKSAHVAGAVTRVYRSNPTLQKQTEYDITEAARRNFEPGGPAATFLFARGSHAIMAYRVTHQLWQDGDTNMALALKAAFGRAFSTDIHPAAQIGAGLWLDHGLGFVVGETSVIDEDVSIWHNVTLGSTLADTGPSRHPHIGRGAVIGAGATILGNIKIGAFANIAAGAIVLENVPERILAVGTKARNVGPATITFASPKSTS